MPQYRTFVPKNVDLSNKELKIRVEDELKAFKEKHPDFFLYLSGGLLILLIIVLS